MRIAIASGKGGTGKTSVAINLAAIAGRSVTLVDCDVEEPNAPHLLEGRSRRHRDSVDEGAGHRRGPLHRLSGLCRVLWLQRPDFPSADHRYSSPIFATGCGGCRLVCRSRAISEVARPLGEVRRIDAAQCTLVEGRLEVGVSSPVSVIKAAKAAATGDFVIYDAPPGTSCPLVATLRGADYVLLVTEPTPFGLSDLRLTVEVLRQMKMEFGVVHQSCREIRELDPRLLSPRSDRGSG